MKKILPASAGNSFLRIASESEKVFARIFDDFFLDGQFKISLN